MPGTPCSIVIPLLNEEEIIKENTARLLRFMDQREIPCEIILGSNGSTDATADIIAELAARHSNVKAFHLDEKGPGLVFARAVQLASHEYILCQDADLSVDLEFIPLAVSLLDRCEMVIGCKRMNLQDRSFLRKLGSNFFIFVAAVVLNVGAADFSLGAKAYRRSFVMPYADRMDSGTAYVLELAYWAVANGQRLIEVPVLCSDNRRSRFKLSQEALHKFGHLFRFASQEKQRLTLAQQTEAAKSLVRIS